MTRHPRDFYPTPHSIITVLLQEIQWYVAEIWEPCAGDGRLTYAIEEHGYKCVSHDIATGNDFFDFTKCASTNLITNPPFKPIRKFIDHAFDIGVERMALVVPERLFACQKGYEQFTKHRPSRFINLSWREDYLGKGGSPDRALALAIWDQPSSPTCQYSIRTRVTKTERK